MAHGDVAEGVEHAFVGDHAVGAREQFARFVEFVWHRHFPLIDWFGAFIAFYRLGDQPAGASSKPSK